MSLNVKAADRAASVVMLMAAVAVAVGAAPAHARVVSSQTIVGTGDAVSALVSSTDGCVESTLYVDVGNDVSPNQAEPAFAGGDIFYTRYDECTGQYLAGVGGPYVIESGGISVNGDLKFGTAQFTTTMFEQVTRSMVTVTIDFTFAAAGDMTHNHNQGIFYGNGYASVSQDSEWYRLADAVGTFSVGGVGATADSQFASMARGKTTIVTQTFGFPFPH